MASEPDLSNHDLILYSTMINVQLNGIFNQLYKIDKVPYWDCTSHENYRSFYVKRFLAITQYKDAIEPSLAWYKHALKADWATPAEVKADFRHASIIKDGRVVLMTTSMVTIFKFEKPTFGY